MTEKKRVNKSVVFTETESRIVQNVQAWHGTNFSETTISLFTAEEARIEKMKTDRTGREDRGAK